MKNIHVLPTNEPSRLSKQLDNPLVLYKQFIENRKFGKWSINQNIYITNDEEIKEGDWCFEVHNGDSKANSPKFIDEKGNTWWLRKANANDITGCPTTKKIILTTDQGLIKDGVQTIDDEFLEWFVKNPSCEEVKIESTYKDFNPITYFHKIIIPKEELGRIPKGTINMVIGKPKQETLEEIAERLNLLGRELYALKLGAKWQQDKNKYSEEEVLDILVKAIKDVKVKQLTFYDGGSEYPIYSNLSKWFKQFKKK